MMGDNIFKIAVQVVALNYTTHQGQTAMCSRQNLFPTCVHPLPEDTLTHRDHICQVLAIPLDQDACLLQGGQQAGHSIQVLHPTEL